MKIGTGGKFPLDQDVVEFAPYSPDDARHEAQSIAKRLGVTLEPSALELLVEACRPISRIATEMEKLSLLAVGRHHSGVKTMVRMPRASTIFALVNALGRQDPVRRRWPCSNWCCAAKENLPLTFLVPVVAIPPGADVAGGNHGRHQLVRGTHTGMGVPMWGSQANGQPDREAGF